jgi:hypothetical protein
MNQRVRLLLANTVQNGGVSAKNGGGFWVVGVAKAVKDEQYEGFLSVSHNSTHFVVGGLRA